MFHYDIFGYLIWLLALFVSRWFSGFGSGPGSLSGGQGKSGSQSGGGPGDTGTPQSSGQYGLQTGQLQPIAKLYMMTCNSQPIEHEEVSSRKEKENGNGSRSYPPGGRGCHTSSRSEAPEGK